ncbi:MAG: hypothetical protein ACRC1K_03375, partial [Planctomycetia bacterium]
MRKTSTGTWLVAAGIVSAAFVGEAAAQNRNYLRAGPANAGPSIGRQGSAPNFQPFRPNGVLVPTSPTPPFIDRTPFVHRPLQSAFVRTSPNCNPDFGCPPPFFGPGFIGFGGGYRGPRDYYGGPTPAAAVEPPPIVASPAVPNARAVKFDRLVEVGERSLAASPPERRPIGLFAVQRAADAPPSRLLELSLDADDRLHGAQYDVQSG